jgi:hypothetical protein
MCIAKNEEAIAIKPNFPECFDNMANAWRVSPFPRESIGVDNMRYSFFHALLFVLLSVAG